jgi:hypothetical protein
MMDAKIDFELNRFHQIEAIWLIELISAGDCEWPRFLRKLVVDKR